MAIREILKMGDARLLRVAQPVRAFDTDELHQLIRDMSDTMHAADGAGLAAPQIGIDLQVVIFGSDAVNPRYPDAPPVPRTVLCNPVITPLSDEEEEDWEGCLSVPGLRGVVPRWRHIRYSGFDARGAPIEREAEGFHAQQKAAQGKPGKGDGVQFFHGDLLSLYGVHLPQQGRDVDPDAAAGHDVGDVALLQLLAQSLDREADGPEPPRGLWRRLDQRAEHLVQGRRSLVSVDALQRHRRHRACGVSE